MSLKDKLKKINIRIDQRENEKEGLNEDIQIVS